MSRTGFGLSKGVTHGEETINRSSITGRIVTKTYAAAHPRTTETERVNVGKRKKK